MTMQQIIALSNKYRDSLLLDVIPFWQTHSPDPKHGGFFTMLDRQGFRYGDDKPVWMQGRQAWLFATLYRTVDRRAAWLDLAQRGCKFLEMHCFDGTGKMYFTVTHDGRPLRMRRYMFSEVFACIAFAALSEITDSQHYRCAATTIYDAFLRSLLTPGLILPKTDSTTRPMKGLSSLMCLLHMADTMIRTGCYNANPAVHSPVLHGAAYYEGHIDDAIDEIHRDFLRADDNCVLEYVGPDGSHLPGPDGRLMNPGHVLEGAWFILAIASRRRSERIANFAMPLIESALHRGWDSKFGGILSFVDVENKPPEQIEHDMKLWWPHSEALLALLLAFEATQDERFARWFQRIHDWSFAHFPDTEHGEWFGYLNRDGTVSRTLKGGLWKGAFHLPRSLLFCWQAMERITQEHTSTSQHVDQSTGNTLQSPT